MVLPGGGTEPVGVDLGGGLRRWDFQFLRIFQNFQNFFYFYKKNLIIFIFFKEYLV